MTKQRVGGWLLLPGICTALIPFVLFVNLIEIRQRPSRDSSPNVLLVGGEEAASLILMVSWFVALYLLLRKSSHYPMISSVCMIGLLVFSMLDVGLGSVVYHEPLGLERLPPFVVLVGIVAAWCAYMKFSKRVGSAFAKVSGAKRK